MSKEIMSKEKKYWWFKFQADFFGREDIDLLDQRGGDRAVLIYLKLLLKTLNTDGEYTFIFDDLSQEEEISMRIKEKVADVTKALAMLKKLRLVVENGDGSLTLTDSLGNIISESSTAERMRKLRNKSQDEKSIDVDKEEEVVEDGDDENTQKKQQAVKSLPQRLNDNDDSKVYGRIDSSLPSIPLADGSNFIIDDDALQEIEKDFPELNVIQELKKMAIWAKANPKKRKTKAGIERFIINWLLRVQNQQASDIRNAPIKNKKSDTKFIDMVQEAESDSDFFT